MQVVVVWPLLRRTVSDVPQQSADSQQPPPQSQSWKEKTFGRTTVFAKKGLKEGFTDNYGDSVNMISFICAVNCRLAYMNDHEFLGHYSQIYGKIIPDKLLEMMNTQVMTNGINGILNDKQMFGDETFGLQPFVSKNEFGGQGLQFLPWAQQINIVNGEQRIDANTPNCSTEVEKTEPNPNLVFLTIATSNYSEIYIVGDKRLPSIVTVIFRGTSDAKSAGSYVKPSSVKSMWTGNIAGLGPGMNSENKEKFLFGIYKILMDTIHALMDSVNYVANQINPSGGDGSVTIISTGHSLGGALATIFGYVYVSHISNLPNHSTLYPKLNLNIGCFSLGSPRVFSINLAKRFCQLTQNNQEVYKDDQEYQQFIQQANIKGRITFLRIVSYKDPVPMLPPSKFGFEHPCSGDERTRKNTNVDCLVQIENSLSTRCAATKRIAMTYNFQDLPLNCVDTKEAREKGLQGPSLAKNLMSYHTEYLGISFIGGIHFENIIGNNPARVKETNNTYKEGDTVCRILFYPTVQGDISQASVGFYDLKLRRSKSNDPALNLSDADVELAESTESLEGVEMIKKEENKEPPAITASPRSEYTDKVLSLLGNMTGLDKKIVEIPQDIYDTEEAFQQIMKNTELYNILTTRAPPIVYNKLIDIDKTQADPSFEGASSGSIEMVSLPKEITGGFTRRKHYKKSRKQRRRKTRKSRKQRRRKTRKR